MPPQELHRSLTLFPQLIEVDEWWYEESLSCDLDIWRREYECGRA